MFKLIKRRFLKRNSGGFTLVEVIISCALLGILILGVIMFVSPILNSVNSTNKNTRASNAAETVEYYISRSIRNAAYITILTNTDFEEASNSDVLAGLLEKYGLENVSGQYSLKCISIRYAMDSKSKTRKYFICNETFDTHGVLQANSGPAPDTMVFDPCYFDGIYPEVVFSPVKVTKKVKQPDGTEKDEDVLTAALEMTVRVYDSEDMNGDDMIFEGVGYTTLRNIDAAYQDANSSLGFNMLDKDNLDSDSEKKLGTLPVKMREIADDDHRETYIFYVERKLSATPTTP